MPNLDQLFRDCAEDLRRYFSHRHEGEDIVQDLIQETFFQLAKGLENERKADCPRGYLFGIARRTSIAAWRKRSQLAEVALPEESSEDLASPVEDDRIQAAKEVMESLAPLQREVLELRFSYGLSYEETAAALNIPLGTVRSRLHHAVAEVRHRLEQDHI